MTTLSATISADTTGFKKTVEEAKNVLKGFTKEESITAETLRKTNDVSQSQVDAYRKTIASIEKATDGTKTYRQQSGALKRELEKLQTQWNNLSETAKKSNFGKSLQASIKVTQNQIKALNVQTNNVAKATAGAKEAFGGMLTSIGKFAPAIGIAAGALDGLKDAFLNSESNIDGWGRTVESAKGTYQAFLDTINNGDWGGLFDRIGKAQKEFARLYDLQDRLGSIRQNNAVLIAQQEAKVASLRLQLQEGKDVAKELKEADSYLRTLKKQESNAAKEAGREAIIATIDSSVSRQLREVVADGLIKGGQAYMDYAEKRVKELEPLVGNTTSRQRVGTDANGMPIYREVEKKLTAQEQALQNEYKALKSLLSKESNEYRTKGLITYKQGVDIETQTDMASRKLVRATAGVGGETWNQKAHEENANQLANVIDEALKGRQFQINIEPSVSPSADLERIDFKSNFQPLEGDEFDKSVNGLSVINSSLESTYDTLKNIGEIENPFQAFDALFAIIQNIQNMMSAMEQLKNVIEAVKMANSLAASEEIASSTAVASAKGTEAAAETTSATAKAFDAHAAIPFVGVAIAGAMVAAMIASIAASKRKVPKFAKGGLISGPTFGLMGEYPGAENNPEVVAPLSKLKGMLVDVNSSNNGRVDFRIEGRALVGILQKESNIISRV